MASSGQHHIATFAILGVFVFALFPAAIFPDASAQPQRSVIRSIDQTPQLGEAAQVISRVPFQQYVSTTATCNACTLNFAVVPKNSRLEITNVSCEIEAGDSPQFDNATLFVKKGSTTITASSLVPQLVDDKVPQSLGASLYNLNHVVSVFAKAHQNFQIYVFVGYQPITYMGCHVSGSMVRLG
jgi:hypothetical protein